MLVLLRKHFFLVGAALALVLMVLAGGLMIVANSAVKAKKAFPEKYGVLGDDMPDGFIRQQAFPFRSTKID